MYRIYLGENFFFYKHKQLFLLPFCCVGLVVLIRITVRVRVRVKITAGGGGLARFGTTTFALGEPAVRMNWTATYWCPLNCSCTQDVSAEADPTPSCDEVILPVWSRNCMTDSYAKRLINLHIMGFGLPWLFSFRTGILCALSISWIDTSAPMALNNFTQMPEVFLDDSGCEFVASSTPIILTFYW